MKREIYQMKLDGVFHAYHDNSHFISNRESSIIIFPMGFKYLDDNINMHKYCFSDKCKIYYSL